MPEALAYIGLGSNLQSPADQVSQAVRELAALPQSRLVACSSLYGSPPMGPSDQPDYVNAVAALTTGLEPRALLEMLFEIERRHGRERLQRWGPRTLDLDLLLYDDRMIDEAGLVVPHPGLPQRAFVLYPLFEIAPELDVPGFGPLAALVDACPRAGLMRIEHAPGLKRDLPDSFT
ncbi:MAG: 2-amino-4-hydroxy-6-hydroxymethyldihydropteridine diphosphokinase [Ectothiorhodospiraceae bacterium]|jgi:2-amino-4-hydroxy-6-hydroxymethyldihydropteridine diphosphokinase|nr:2-amino-4-hydroxy-6-hydroxymethyldihydropteridine diphosphokinase [Ectothiorhodospiraceae bacterium]